MVSVRGASGDDRIAGKRDRGGDHRGVERLALAGATGERALEHALGSPQPERLVAVERQDTE
jgi:hypothetical protein